MRSCPVGLSVAPVPAALLFGALPASAKPADSQGNSFHTDLDRHASALMAEGKWALTAAADAVSHAVHNGSATLANESDAAKHLQEFRAALNERKARLGMIGAELTTPTDQDDAAELTTPTDQD
jgi:hypothetical protein